MMGASASDNSRGDEHKMLALCGSVSKQWNHVSRLNCLSEDQCRKLWSNKVYVPERYRILLAQGKAQEALKGSVLDSQRTAITMEEFWGIPFFFRFKKAAGRYLMDLDPFWQNNRPLCINFRKDGPIDGLPALKWTFPQSVGKGEDGLVCSSHINVTIGESCILVYEVSRHSNWGFIIQVSALFLSPRKITLGGFSNLYPSRSAEPMGYVRFLPLRPVGGLHRRQVLTLTPICHRPPSRTAPELHGLKPTPKSLNISFCAKPLPPQRQLRVERSPPLRRVAARTASESFAGMHGRAVIVLPPRRPVGWALREPRWSQRQRPRVAQLTPGRRRRRIHAACSAVAT